MWIFVGIAVTLLVVIVLVTQAFLKAIPNVPEGYRLPTLGKELILMSTKEKTGIGDKMIEHQLGLNVTAIGSKPPEDEEEDEDDD